MRLIGKEKLTLLQQAGQDGKKWISNWSTEISHANWKHESELIHRYPSVIAIGRNVFLFKVGNSGLLVKAKISFLLGIVLVESLSES